MDITNLQTVDQAIAARNDRPVHVFTIPKKLQQHGVTNIGLVELNGNEELVASKRARGDQARAVVELATESLRFVDGRPVSTANGTADAALSRMHPKVRTLVVNAYAKLHSVEADEMKDFLDSQTTEVG